LRLTRSIAALAATLTACAGLLLVPGPGASAATRHALPPYDPATQSHPGACSQDTLEVARAVSDLSANGVLGQYSVLVGVHATGAKLTAEMDKTLVVVHVAASTVTANHGCTTDGLIFAAGPRTLTAGETVGVGLPAALRARVCAGSTAGCERLVLTEHTVFPTNCWNLDQGSVRVVVYVHRKPRVNAKVSLLKPSASVQETCGIGSAGTATVTLANGRGADRSAVFIVDGRRYGPVAPGASRQVTLDLSASASVHVRVSSGGEVLINQLVPSDTCPTNAPPPAPQAQPSAKAALSCAAGGVVVTLSNGTGATADASFDVNGTTYGPLTPGESKQVTVTVAPGQTGTVTVSSGGLTILAGESYSNSCKSAPSALAALYCASPTVDPSGGGTLVVQLANGDAATLPASFTVSATGNTTSGYGPATIGPIAPGASQTLLIPVDGSGNPVSVNITSGAQTLFSGTVAPNQTGPFGSSQGCEGFPIGA